MAAAAEKKIYMGFYAPASLARAFDEIARREDLNRSQVLRRLARQHIAETGNARPQPSTSEDPGVGERARGEG